MHRCIHTWDRTIKQFIRNSNRHLKIHFGNAFFTPGMIYFGGSLAHGRPIKNGVVGDSSVYLLIIGRIHWFICFRKYLFLRISCLEIVNCYVQNWFKFDCRYHYIMELRFHLILHRTHFMLSFFFVLNNLHSLDMREVRLILLSFFWNERNEYKQHCSVKIKLIIHQKKQFLTIYLHFKI